MTRNELLFLLGLVLLVFSGIALLPVEPRGADIPHAYAVDWRSVSDAPGKRLTISWCGSPAYPSARRGTWVQNHVEKVFNVDLRPIFLDWNAYRNRRPLMLSGGDVPDVCWDGDPLQVRRNVHQGFVLEVPYDLILRYAPAYVRNLNRYGPEAWLYSSFCGRNYGIPTFAAGDIYPYPMLWRMDWLRKAGFSRPPETLDELHTALWKFRYEDPDGNGVRDTYGMCPEIHWSVSFVEIFVAFGILPQDFIMRDGKVVWGGIQPEAKQVLALLRQWYQEELIDPDFAIGSVGNSPTERKFNNGRTGYMYLWGSFADFDLSNPNSRYATMKLLDPRVELAPGKPLIGLDGQRRARVWGGPGHVFWFGAPVAREPEKVIRVLRMFEALATNRQLFIEARSGKKGVHWDWSPRRGLYLLPPYDERGEDGRNLLTLSLESCYGFFSPCAVPLDLTREFLREGELAFRRTYCDPAWGFKNAVGKSDVVPSAGRYLEDLRQFQTTAFIQIIRGDRPLDYFDEFVRTWKSRGGDILAAEANEMHREMQAIYRQVGIRSQEAAP